MKKIQIMFTMVIFISLVTTNVTAQSGVNNIRTNSAEFFTPGTEGNTPDYKSMAKLNKASSKALSNFNKTFKNEPDAKWFVEKNVLVATFTKDDILTKSVYDKKGHWKYTMKTYQENKMPGGIRSLVKRSIYFDYNISLVQQIEEGAITFYIVHLENGKKYKQISVYEGEINVIEEFDQQ